jgi:5-methylcytosine-specific restriction endonuclease McrA
MHPDREPSIFEEVGTERGRLARKMHEEFIRNDDSDPVEYFARLRQLKSLPRDWVSPQTLRHRATPSAGLRRQILDGAVCAYCGDPDPDVIDHIFPVSRGGTGDQSNLAPSCYPCNAEKFAATPDEWREWRLSHGLSWPVDRVADGIRAIKSIAAEPDRIRHDH